LISAGAECVASHDFASFGLSLASISDGAQSIKLATIATMQNRCFLVFIGNSYQGFKTIHTGIQAPANYSTTRLA
jgi:hypothetical protein